MSSVGNTVGATVFETVDSLNALKNNSEANRQTLINLEWYAFWMFVDLTIIAWCVVLFLKSNFGSKIDRFTEDRSGISND